MYKSIQQLCRFNYRNSVFTKFIVQLEKNISMAFVGHTSTNAIYSKHLLYIHFRIIK